MKLKPYLVGQISWDERSWRWRENVETLAKAVATDYDIEIINPCNSDMHAQITKYRQEFGETLFNDFVAKYVRHKPLLTPRDKYYVKYSNCAIANLIQYDIKRPLIGSFFELAWYHDTPEKMVIAIHPDPANDMTGIANHPFILDTVHYFVKDEAEAFKLLIDLWPKKF